MNIDDVFLKELYQDFSTKNKSLEVYLQKLSEANTRVKEKSIALVSAMKEKFEILSDFRAKKLKPNPATQFSIENDFDRDAMESADDNLQKTDIKIEQIKKSINHEFRTVKESLKTLETLFDKYAEGVNEIYDTWEGIIETKE